MASYHSRLLRYATVSDEVGDETRVMRDGNQIHVVIFDQTMTDGLDDAHEPDGGWPEYARGVYSAADARQIAMGLLAAAREIERSPWLTTSPAGDIAHAVKEG